MFGMASDFSFISSLLVVFAEDGGPAHIKWVLSSVKKIYSSLVFALFYSTKFMAQSPSKVHKYTE